MDAGAGDAAVQGGEVVLVQALRFHDVLEPVDQQPVQLLHIVLLHQRRFLPPAPPPLGKTPPGKKKYNRSALARTQRPQ
jgi:hypothetical protein